MSARTETTNPDYYPRRARWYSRFWYPWHRFQQAAHLEWIHLPAGLKPHAFLLSLLVPGYLLRAMGLKTIGSAVIAAYVVLVLTFFAALGFVESNVAFGLMISAHATSVALLLQRWLQPTSLRWRIGLCLVALALVGFGVYVPLRDRVLAQYLPLRIDGHVVMVRQGGGATPIRPGDVVAFRLEGSRFDGPVFLAAGYGIEPILGVAGDRVVFTPEGYEVNGERRPLLRNMPTSGDVVVPQKHFFVWPRLDIVNRAGPGVDLPAAILQTAMIHESQVVGRPRRHWFGRRQSLP